MPLLSNGRVSVAEQWFKRNTHTEKQSMESILELSPYASPASGDKPYKIQAAALWKGLFENIRFVHGSDWHHNKNNLKKKKKKRLSEIVCLQREKSTASFSVLTDRALFIDHFLWYYQSQWTKSIHLHTKCSFIYLFNKSVKQWSNLLCNFIATLSINQQFYSKSIAYIYDHYTVKLHPQLQIENDFICWKDAWLNWLLHRQRVFT